jgi:hypothetical protein
MFNKENYKQEVFQKYKNEVNNINFQTKNKKLKLIPSFALICLILVSITVVAYTGNEIHKKTIEQNWESIPGVLEIGKYGYTLMKDINEDYIEEQAFNEDCIVIKSFNLVSDNKDKIYDFVKNTKANINSGIRFLKLGEFEGETKFVIIDVVYYEENYYVCVYNYNRNDDGQNFAFVKAGDTIKLIEYANCLGINIEDSTRSILRL